MELLVEATWMLDAPIAAPPPPTNRQPADRGRAAKRAGYGGTFTGCLLSIDPDSPRTVHLNVELRRLLDAGPYDQRPVELFALARPGHTNPRGTKPSRAACWLIAHGVWDYARFRQQQALQRGGAVQAVAVEDLLGRWTSVDVEGICRRRLMPAVVDRLEVELGAGVDVCLAAPIERHRRPGRCELRLRISLDRRPRSHPSPAGQARRGGRGGGDDRRPPVSATSTGRAASTGPPPS